MSGSNQLAVYLPFALGILLVGGAMAGSRLTASRRHQFEFFVLSLLIAGLVAADIWLTVHRQEISGHFYLPFVLPFNTFLIVGGVLSRRYLWLQRPFGVAAGLLIVAMAIAMPLRFPGHSAPALFRWAIIVSGALITMGAALNWLPTTEDDTPMRPTAGRPPRHFGEAS